MVVEVVVDMKGQDHYRWCKRNWLHLLCNNSRK